MIRPPLKLDSPTRSRIKALLCEGRSNKAIARTVGVELCTVKTHLNRIYKQMGVHNRVQAAVALVRQEAGR